MLSFPPLGKGTLCLALSLSGCHCFRLAALGVRQFLASQAHSLPRPALPWHTVSDSLLASSGKAPAFKDPLPALLLLLPACSPPSSAGYHWFSTSWEWPALFCLLGRAETRKGGKIIQMSSWIELLKAASSLPQRGHTAKETWGGLNSRKSGWKWLWVARKAFPAFLSDENPPFPRRKGGRVPLLGDCFGMRKASRDRLLGKGERGLAGWAGPLSTSLEQCRAVGRRLNLTPVLLAAIYTHSDISV